MIIWEPFLCTVQSNCKESFKKVHCSEQCFHCSTAQYPEHISESNVTCYVKQDLYLQLISSFRGNTKITSAKFIWIELCDISSGLFIFSKNPRHNDSWPWSFVSRSRCYPIPCPKLFFFFFFLLQAGSAKSSLNLSFIPAILSVGRHNFWNLFASMVTRNEISRPFRNVFSLLKRLAAAGFRHNLSFMFIFQFLVFLGVGPNMYVDLSSEIKIK